MHAEGMNLLLLAGPLLLVLVAGVLRVDEHVFTSDQQRKSVEARSRFSVIEQDGEVLLTDPDGRPFGTKGNQAKSS
jgi:hypothetical protein